MVDDNNYQYHQPYVDPAYDSNSLVERNGEYPDPEEDYSPGSNDGAYDGYNPEMHTFANGTE